MEHNATPPAPVEQRTTTQRQHWWLLTVLTFIAALIGGYVLVGPQQAAAAPGDVELLANGGFESGITGWTEAYAGYCSAVTDTVRTGAQSLRCGGGGGQYLRTPVSIEAGKRYRASWWIYQGDAAAWANVLRVNIGGADVLHTGNCARTLNAWRECVTSELLAGSSGSGYLEISTNLNAAMRYDDVSFVEVAPAPGGAGEIVLSWSDNWPGRAFTVQRKQSWGTWSSIAFEQKTGSYTVKRLTPGSYTFRVRDVADNFTSNEASATVAATSPTASPSSSAAPTTTAAPATTLTAALSGSNKAALTWADTTGKYSVLKKTSYGTFQSLTYGTTGGTWTSGTLPAGNHCYKVRHNTTSALSNESCITVASTVTPTASASPSPTAAPAAPTLSIAPNGATKFTLTWTDATGKYSVLKKTSYGTWSSLTYGTTGGTYTTAALAAGQHCFKVRHNTTSVLSNEVCGTIAQASGSGLLAAVRSMFAMAVRPNLVAGL
jgi:hypothetical protein